MYWHNPTLESLTAALYAMRLELEDYIESSGSKSVAVAMPKIGCGLDRLNWNDVEKAIEETFCDIDFILTIVVCDYRRK